MNYLLDDTISYYKSIINRWFEIEKTLDPEKFMMVKFEDMIANPEKVVLEMCSFVKLDFEPEMIDTDLSKSNTGRWKVEFDLDAAQTINRELEIIILKLGYDTNMGK